MDVSLDYILFHYISSLSTINISESSTLSNFDILIKHSTSGWLELVHHFEMVVLSFPSCSASHKPVFFFSTSNSFRRFNSLCVIIFNLYRKITIYYQQTFKNSLIFMLFSQQVENYSIVLCLFRGLNYNIKDKRLQAVIIYCIERPNDRYGFIIYRWGKLPIATPYYIAGTFTCL